MSGYIESGYVIALVTLGSYATFVLRREHLLRRRLGGPGDAPLADREPGANGPHRDLDETGGT